MNGRRAAVAVVAAVATAVAIAAATVAADAAHGTVMLLVAAQASGCFYCVLLMLHIPLVAAADAAYAPVCCC